MQDVDDRQLCRWPISKSLVVRRRDFEIPVPNSDRSRRRDDRHLLATRARHPLPSNAR
jgi:hypothetical protein